MSDIIQPNLVLPCTSQDLHEGTFLQQQYSRSDHSDKNPDAWMQRQGAQGYVSTSLDSDPGMNVTAVLSGRSIKPTRLGLAPFAE